MIKTPEKVVEARKLRSEGLSWSELGRHFGLHQSSVRMWVEEDARKKKLSSRVGYMKEYFLQNKDKLKQSGAEYYKKNRERSKELTAKWARENKDKINANHHRKWKTDPQYRLSCLLHSRLTKAIRRNTKRGSAVDDLGCSVAELKVQLESQFQDGMSWENQGQWHIDHVKPLASFDLADREQFLEAVHHTNLQPLWERDNLIKGSS